MKKLFSIALFCMSVSPVIQAQNISTIAGNGTAGFTADGIAATSTALYRCDGITYDTAGNLYISDQQNHRIRKINTSGIISTIAGTGIAGFSGDGGPATAARINTAGDLLVDIYGNVIFGDASNHVVRKINTAGIISTIAGTGVAGFSGDGGAATAARLYVPIGVFMDNFKNIYIADQRNNRIRKVDSFGVISTIAGNGIGTYSGDGGPATSASIYYPNYVHVTPSGTVYFTDNGNHSVRKVNSSGIISTVAGSGVLGSSGDGGAATAATLNYPAGITTDETGNLYISDYGNHRIRLVNASGVIFTIAGTGTAGFAGDGGPATASRLKLPIDVTFSNDGNLIIADYDNNRIRKITYHNASFTSSATTICEDSCLSLTSTSTGLIDSIRWQITPSGATISAPTSVVTSVCFPLSGTYNIRLKAYGSGYVDSSSTTVYVTPSPSPLIVRAGTTLSILGGPYTGYQWYNGASLIAGATSATYTFSSPSVYTVVVDSAGCKGTSNALNTLSVNAMSANAPVYWVAPSGSEMLSIFSSVVVSNSISVTVRDITGRIVTNTDWLGGTNRLSISTQNFASGLYIISLTTHEGIYPIKWFKP